jgi:uncharacterized repeat protein (TIGR02543 family)
VTNQFGALRLSVRNPRLLCVPSIKGEPAVQPPPFTQLPPLTQQLVVSKQGDGTGAVQSSPTGIDCGTVCTASFAAGTKVTLTPTPATGSFFDVFSGDCTGSGPCVVTMDRDRSVTVQFRANPPPKFQLSVSEQGSGAGRVTSNPSGIDCPTSCSGMFNAGTMITLTASATAGFTFSGWGGDCTGVQGPLCTVTMDRARSVTASFSVLPPACTVGLTLLPTPPGTVSGVLQCTKDATGFSITAMKTGQMISPPIQAFNQTTSTPLNCTAPGTATGTCNGAVGAGQMVQFRFATTGVQAVAGDSFGINVTNGAVSIFSGTSTLQ